MAQIKGNIGSEIKKIAGKGDKGPFFSFNLAENNGKDRDPTWYEVTAFVEEADGDLLSKGQWVEITGRIEVQSFTKKDQSQGYALRLITGKVVPVQRT